MSSSSACASGVVVLLRAVAVVVVALAAAGGRGAHGQDAICVFRGEAGTESSSIQGSVTFTARSGGFVEMAVNVVGITTNPDTPHGVHIHQYGDPRSGPGVNALSFGGHFDPANCSCHGCPDEGNSTVWAMGDTGNWNASGGVISASKNLTLLSLSGADSIIGRGVVLHAAADNCVTVPSSGIRLAACVIGLFSSGVASGAGTSGNTAASNGPALCALGELSYSTSAPNGLVYFDNSAVQTAVTAKIFGMTNNSIHGFHIHAYGDIRTGATTGAHYDPTGIAHGLPPGIRSVGDMGNIYHYDSAGVAYYSYDNNLIAVSGATSVVGRACMVHALQDLCTATSSGTRYLWGVVGLANPGFGGAITLDAATPTTQDDSVCAGTTGTTANPSTTSTTGTSTGTTGTTGTTGVPSPATTTTVSSASSTGVPQTTGVGTTGSTTGVGTTGSTTGVVNATNTTTSSTLTGAPGVTGPQEIADLSVHADAKTDRSGVVAGIVCGLLFSLLVFIGIVVFLLLTQL